MEIYRVSYYDYDDHRGNVRVFNNFQQACDLYNDLCSEYVKSWGVRIDISLCDFVNGELERVLEVAYTYY